MWLYVAIAFLVLFVLLVLGVGLWLLIGPGPVRSRAYNRARRALDQGDWKTALATAEPLRTPRLSPAWQDKLRAFAGEARQAATDAALKNKQFEEALEHSIQAAALLGAPDADARARVIDAMLAEVRRQFAAGPDATDGVLQLLGRVFALQNPCAEARFWQGIENYVLDNARAEDVKVSVFTGPIFASTDPVYRSVRVPIQFYKIVARVDDGQLKATALLASQSEFLSRLPERLRGERFDDLGRVQQYQTTVARIEEMSGINFGLLRDADTFGDSESLETPLRPLKSFDDIALGGSWVPARSSDNPY